MKIPLIKDFQYDMLKTMTFAASALEKIGAGALLVALFPVNGGIWMTLYAVILATICFAVEFVLVNSKE